MGTGINKVTLLGNLGQSPETKFSKDGTEYCLFSVATDESWRNANGQKFDSVCWHSVIAWKRLAGICAKYLRKGSRVYLEGKIQNGKYESEGSIKYYSRILLTEVQHIK